MNGITEMAQSVNELLEQSECKTFSDVERGIQQILKEVGQAIDAPLGRGTMTPQVQTHPAYSPPKVGLAL